MKPILIALSISFTSLLTTACKAQLVMTLSGTPGSSIVGFELSGSTVSNAGITNPISGLVLSVTDTFDPFPAALNAGLAQTDTALFPILSGGAAININGTFGINAFNLILEDSSFRGTERFGVLPAADYSLSSGDTVSWNGSGTIDLSPQGLTFNDLTPGIGQSVGGFVVAGVDGELRVVPEPSSLILLLATLPALGRRRAR